MKNCILTPTFIGHFCFLDKYLKSFQLNVEDKDNCVIYFIINKKENSELKKITKKYKNIDIQILFFEDILKKFNIDYSPEELLDKYGKFSFQAMKKFYGMLFLEEYQRFLVLDTESMWINKTNMTNCFNDFFNKRPFILYSNVRERLKVSKSNAQASKNINYILSSNCDKWFVEQYIRFWDVNILKDIFREYGACFEIVDKIYNSEIYSSVKIGLFESVLYDQYIYENNSKYNYNLIDVNAECRKYLEEDTLNRYYNQFFNIWQGSCGILESMSIILNKDNYAGFGKLYKENNLNIIRVEETNIENYKFQKQFLEIVKPNILTCSQKHCFGINNNILNIIKINKEYIKLEKHILRFLAPLKMGFNWMFEPISIFWHAVLFLLKIPKIINLYLQSRETND